jgi:hypothetical protein
LFHSNEIFARAFECAPDERRHLWLVIHEQDLFQEFHRAVLTLAMP